MTSVLQRHNVLQGIGALFSRTLLFLVAGFFIIGIGWLVSGTHSMGDTGKWWFFQVIVVNLVYLLVFYFNRRTINVFSAIRQFRKDFRWINFFIMFSGFAVLSVGGIILASYIIYGHVQGGLNLASTLPLSALLPILILFPLLQAYVELPFYFIFAKHLLQKANITPLASGFLIVFFLALQHVVIPTTDDIRFIIFRFLSFILLGTFITIAWHNPKNRFALMAAHYIMDLMAVIQILMISGTG